MTIKDRQAQPVPKRRSSLVQHTAHVVHYSTRGKEHHHFVSLCGRRENVTACTPQGEGGRHLVRTQEVHQVNELLLCRHHLQ